MPRHAINRSSLLTVESVLDRCAGLAQTPFAQLGNLLSGLVTGFASDDNDGWEGTTAQELLRYLNALLNKLPTPSSDRFLFDAVMIREVTDSWSGGGVIQMSPAIVPVCGDQWQLERWPVAPAAHRPGEGHAVQFLTVHGANELNDRARFVYP
jgi:hypothetical protein